MSKSIERRKSVQRGGSPETDLERARRMAGGIVDDAIMDLKIGKALATTAPTVTEVLAYLNEMGLDSSELSEKF